MRESCKLLHWTRLDLQCTCSVLVTGWHLFEFAINKRPRLKKRDLGYETEISMIE